MKKRILGLDPGLAILGFGGIIGDGLPSESSFQSAIGEAMPGGIATRSVQLIDFGIISTPAKSDMGQRLCTIYEDLNAVIAQIQPDLVAIEKLFFYRMGNTIAVAQARGVVMLVLAQHNLPIIEFTPAQIKQTMTGMGNADKSQVQQAVAQELDLAYIPKPDDAADALAVALTAWCHHF